MIESPPRTADEVRERTLAAMPDLPGRLRQCADWVLTHPEKIAVTTVAGIAEGAGVQPSAVMRFCQVLGFSGFSEMQRLYRDDLAGRWPDYATRLERLRDRDHDGRAASLVLDFVGAGLRSLNVLAETLDAEALDRAVTRLAAAPTIHLAGFRRSFPAACYLAYVFEKMGIAAILHGAPGGLRTDSAFRSGDVLLVVTVAPYAEETLALAARATAAGASLVAITDGPGAPIAATAAVTLVVREIDVGAFRALSATLTLATALAVAVGTERARHGGPEA